MVNKGILGTIIPIKYQWNCTRLVSWIHADTDTSDSDTGHSTTPSDFWCVYITENVRSQYHLVWAMYGAAQIILFICLCWVSMYVYWEGWEFMVLSKNTPLKSQRLSMATTWMGDCSPSLTQKATIH